MATNDGTFLPEEVVIQILKRLPVESLLRFKCVCKLWYNLIKTPFFISEHYQHDSNQNLLLVHYCIILDNRNRENPKSAFALFHNERLTLRQNLQYPKMPSDLADIVGPVNGLFLLRKDSCILSLWNPATRDQRTLPELIPDFPHYIIPCYDSLGFGLDPHTDDYKVISIRYFWDTRLYTPEDLVDNPSPLVPVIGVYNLGTDSWTLLDPDLAKIPPNPIYGTSSIYLNGVHYWLSRNNSTIVAFDAGNEVFREVRAPAECTLGYLSLYNDTIALISRVVESVPTYVWVMELEGCWTKRFTIDHLSELSCPLGLWKNNELLFEDRFSELVLYKLNTHETRNIGIKGFEYGISVFNYKESLVSVNVGKKKSERPSFLDIIRGFLTHKCSKLFY